jgi:hypothetical protein
MSGATIQLWHRVAYVLVAAGAPWALPRLAKGRGALSVLHRHPEIGARLAEAMGAPQRVVRLIAEDEDGHLQDRLRAADDAS